MPFEPGISGNPDGRPKGSKGFRARFFEYLAEKNQGKVESGVNWLFELVDSKDFDALRLMLEYFGCKAKNDDDKSEEQSKSNPLANAPDNIVDKLMLVLEGKADVILRDKEKENDIDS